MGACRCLYNLALHQKESTDHRIHKIRKYDQFNELPNNRAASCRQAGRGKTVAAKANIASAKETSEKRGNSFGLPRSTPLWIVGSWMANHRRIHAYHIDVWMACHRPPEAETASSVNYFGLCHCEVAYRSRNRVLNQLFRLLPLWGRLWCQRPLCCLWRPLKRLVVLSALQNR